MHHLFCSVNTLNAECPEFQTYKECTDFRDFQNHHCRKQERPVIEFWNKKMGYDEVAPVAEPHK